MPPTAAPISAARPLSWLRIGSPGDVEWCRVSVELPNLPAALVGKRVIHLSDMHLTGRWHQAYDRLIEQVNAADADAIAFTGDLIDNRWNPTRRVIENARRFFNGLKSKHGTFAILGNHDGDLLAWYIARCNCALLHPGMATIDFGAATLEFVGLPCVHRVDVTRRLLRRFPAKPANTVRIILSHYPDHVGRVESLDGDIILVGHTHGGQVCWPGGRPIITHDRLPKHMACGVHKIGETTLIVSRGIGFATLPIRVFASPQVVEVILT